MFVCRWGEGVRNGFAGWRSFVEGESESFACQ